MPKLNKTLAKAVKAASKTTEAERAKLALNAAKARAVHEAKAREDADLTGMQEAFVLEYPKDYNITRAYFRASAAYGRGCSMQAASSGGSVMLRNVRIKKFVADADAERKLRYEVTPARIVAEIAKMAFTDMGDFTLVDDETGGLVTDFRGASPEQIAAITEVTVETIPTREYNDDGSIKYITRTKFKLGSKQGALELLAKTQRMLIDRKEVTGADGQPLQPPAIQINFVDPPLKAAMPVATPPKQLEGS